MDTSFGSGGQIITSLQGGGVSGAARDVFVQSDGKIVVEERFYDGSTWNIGARRYNSNGTLDTSFGSSGFLDSGFNQSKGQLLLNADDSFVVFSQESGDFSIKKYTANGSLDTSFGTSGTTTIDLGGSEIGYNVATQSDGKYLLSGESNGNMAVARVNTDGSLDTTFGTNGILLTNIAIDNYNEMGDISVNADDSFQITGIQHNGSDYDVVLAQFEANGSLSSSFGDTGGGNTLDGNPTFVEDGPAVVLDADVQIFDAELSGIDNFNGATLTLVRDGGANADDSFSESGLLSAITESGNLTYNGTTVGTVSTNSGGTLVLTFNNSATNTLVNIVMQSIAYSNGNDTPPASVEIDWSFNDGNTGSQGSGGALVATGSTIVDISSVNDAPVLDNSGVTTLTSVLEDSVSNAGDTVADIIASAGGDRITDPDGPAEGIAVYFTDSANGSWEFSLDGGSTWLELDSVSASQARLLDPTSLIRFEPAPDFNGTAAMSFRAWDQSSGSVGDSVVMATAGTSLSSGIETAIVTVTPVNDAPTLDLDANDSSGATVNDFSTDFMVGGSPVLVADVDATLGDIDSANLDSLIVTITDQQDGIGAEVLAADTSGTSLVASYNSASYALTISGSGTVAEYEQVLRTVTYQNTSIGSGAGRTITFVADDGTNSSLVATTNVDFTANQVPSVDLNGAGAGIDNSVTFIENAAPLLVAPDAVVDDSGEGDIVSLNLDAIGFQAIPVSEQMLFGGVTVTGGIASSGTVVVGSTTVSYTYDGGNAFTFTNNSGVSDPIPAVDLELLIRSIQYQNLSDDPATGNIDLQFAATDSFSNDSPLATSSVTVDPVNDAPVVGTNVNGSVLEGGRFTLINGMLNESDPDDDGVGVTYLIRTDVNGGTLLLNGTALDSGDTFTQADIDNGDVEFQHAGGERPSVGVNLRILDGGEDGATGSNFAWRVDVSPENDAPVAADDPVGSAPNLVSDPDTLGFWRLGESSGTTAIDESGTSNGTYNNVTLGATGVGGGNTSADFDGSTSYVDLGNLDANGTGLTMAAWVNFDSITPADGRIFGKSDGSFNADHTWMLSTYDVGADNYLRFRLSAGGHTDSIIASEGPGLTTGQWYHVAATYDNATGLMSMYVDGQLIEQTQHTVGGAVDQDPTRNVWIGGNPVGANFFDGRIDEAILMQRAMTTSEIASLAELAAPDYSVAENGSLTVNAANGVLQNDSDVENDPLDVEAVNGNPGDVGSQITLGSGALLTLNADGSFDYDPNGQFENLGVGQSTTDTFTYTVTDNNGGTDSATVTVTVNGQNDDPSGSGSLTTTSLDDNIGATTLFGGLSVSDVDASENDLSLTITLTDPAAGTISGGGFTHLGGGVYQATGLTVVQANTALDNAQFTPTNNTGPSGTFNTDISVTVNDQGGSGEHNVLSPTTVTINRVNDDPSGSGTLTTTSLNDNAGATNLFGGLTVSDVDAGENDLSLTITLTDPTAGTITGGGFTHLGGGVYQATGLTVAQADTALDNAQFTPTDNTGPSGTFSTDVGVTINDQGGGGEQIVLAPTTLTISRVNDNPVITSSGGGPTALINVSENTTSVATITATDVDLETPTYTITGGSDQLLFNINLNSGALEFNAAPDFELPADVGSDNTYVVEVTASDGNLGADVQTITVVVNDVNEAPTISLTPVVANLAEDADTSSPIVVATISVTDDALGTETLTLSGADLRLLACFEIVGNDLRLISGASLDFETNPTLDVTVNVDDAAIPGTPEDSASHSINVIDANEPPTISLTPVVANLAEDADTSSPIVVATISVTDDALGTETLTLSGADAGMFEIVGNDLRLISGASLDFETNPTLDVTVNVDDAPPSREPRRTPPHIPSTSSTPTNHQPFH